MTDRTAPRYVIRVRTGGEELEAWTTTRLPFQPKGWLRDLRAQMRDGLRQLDGADGAVFHGIYASPLPDSCDAENVLFYNVGLNYLPRARGRGMRFERGYTVPPAPETLASAALHYHRYRVSDSEGFFGWSQGRTLARWSSPLGVAPTHSATVWKALKFGQLDAIDLPPTRVERFGVRATVSAPSALDAALLMKPVLDGAISALHAYDGSEVELIADRLARSVAIEPRVVRALLLDRERAVLGPRRFLWPRDDGVQWNPADDACLAAELLVTQGRNWHLAGELFELQALTTRVSTGPAVYR